MWKGITSLGMNQSPKRKDLQVHLEEWVKSFFSPSITLPKSPYLLFCIAVS